MKFTLIMLALLATSILFVDVQPVKSDWTWTETIYIRADGSFEPDTAPISTVDNITYTLTDNIVGDVPEDSDAIVVERDNIVVDGASYTIEGTGAFRSTGIDLTDRSNVTIKRTIIKGFHMGIRFYDSSKNRVSGNNLTNNDVGIWLRYSSNNTISGNNITNNGQYAVYIESSSYNILSENNLADNDEDCIYLIYSSNNTISGNDITNNYFGISFHDSSNTTISGNNIIASVWTGIETSISSNNRIIANNITNSEYGIYAFDFSNSSISENKIIDNGGGVFLGEGCSDNRFYHNNFINNTVQANVTFGYANIWDDGYPSGGNYWSNYTGVDVKSGPNQDEPSSDGIGDTAYVIDANNTDHYPLMYPWGAPSPPSYTLTIHSSPTGVTFTVDGIYRSTPWSGTYSEGTSVSLVMPETHDGYIWFRWSEDKDTNRAKTVTMDTNITLTGLFTRTIGGKATPINIPMSKPETPALWIWLITIILSLIVTVGYVKKRKQRWKD